MPPYLILFNLEIFAAGQYMHYTSISAKIEPELGAIGEIKTSVIKHSAMNTKKLDTDTAQPIQLLAHQTNEGRGSRVKAFPLQRRATRTVCVRNRECCKRRTSTCDLRR